MTTPLTAPTTTVALGASTPLTEKGTGVVPFQEDHPYPTRVELGAVIDRMVATILLFVACDPHTAIATALWVIMTRFVDLFDILPLAIITAPEMRCGKSILLRLIAKLVPRPLEADNISVAALFRAIELWTPTLILDETDAWARKNEDLRGVLNAGHLRGGSVFRCFGRDHHLKRFNVFCAKALAGIGSLAATLMDRGIQLKLRRRLLTEVVSRLRDYPDEYFIELRSQLARVALDYSALVAAARPTMPDCLNDRAQDNWEPLLRIASAAGGDWLDRAVRAAIALSGDQNTALSSGVQLLTDIHAAFASRNVDRLSSADLINTICSDPERPWSTVNKGHPITQVQVAKRLREYGIYSNTIRVRFTTAKGYYLRQFADAFARYLPADSAVGAADVTASRTPAGGSSYVTFPLPVTAPEVTGNTDVAEKAPDSETCDVVTPKSGTAAAPPMSVNEFVLSEFKWILASAQQERSIQNQDAPDGILFDDAVNHLIEKFPHLDDNKKLQRAVVTKLLNDLVHRSKLVSKGNLLLLPTKKELS